MSSNAGWHQSYCFAGAWGSGKTTTARILARALLCEGPIEGEACDKCSSCISMLDGTSDSYIEVDSATNSGKADMKKLLEEIDYSSFSGRRRLYLFDESHQLSKDALDAMLKSMEDNRPGSNEKRLVCIFATTEPEKMRQTILSRCAPAFIIKTASMNQIADRLAYVCKNENIEYEYDALLLIANMTEGHIRDALKAVEGVATGNSKRIGLKEVRAYLHIDRNDIMAKILVSDQKESMDLLSKVLENTPVGVAYDRLIEASMWAIKIGYGITGIPPYWNMALLKEAWEMNGQKLLILADELSGKPLRPTNSMLICDIMKWKSGAVINKIIVNEEKKVEKIDLPGFFSIVRDKIKTM